MQIRSWLWATVAFAAELASLAALAVAGWALPAPTALRVLAAIGFPLVAAVLWGLFAAPRSVVHVPALAVVTKVVVHGAAVLALVLLGHPVLAVVLAVAALLGATLSRPVIVPAAG
ncbi:YrdB family protein [Petropleomorpha daqingensis]|uniref:Multidrug transporter EmrE-like cation transporter n=1 Tax=Petropleomorpha daqingensis TaxID=2026353 RepID=A0A853CGF8_9ACTN|nr:YrdB family protein [Petropleomorpha daqingensis]NYJ05163.1 multidrug transporter EmrE-like cation transporter [Petropleomorpha daqingensis]